MPETVRTGKTLGARAMAHHLFWPLVALGALLVVNLIATPTFFNVRIQDGHLFGSLVDIVRNGAPVLLVAIGMTLVIATRGIDLSVGAVAAIAGAVACVYIVKSPADGAAGTAVVAITMALAVSWSHPHWLLPMS